MEYLNIPQAATVLSIPTPYTPLYPTLTPSVRWESMTYAEFLAVISVQERKSNILLKKKAASVVAYLILCEWEPSVCPVAVSQLLMLYATRCVGSLPSSWSRTQRGICWGVRACCDALSVGHKTDGKKKEERRERGKNRNRYRET